MSLVLCAVDSSLPASHPHSQLLFISIFACAREAGILLAGPAGSGALPGGQASASFGREHDDMSLCTIVVRDGTGKQL